MRHLSIDIETYSSVDIKKSGLYKYVQSPDFEILLFAYSWDGGPVEIVDLKQGEFIPHEVIQALFATDTTKHAYSAAFEWYCLCKHFAVTRPDTWLKQWRCTQIHGLYLGYPAGLGKVGEAMGLPRTRRKWVSGAP